jgi:hypothetical protein
MPEKDYSISVLNIILIKRKNSAVVIASRKTDINEFISVDLWYLFIKCLNFG